MAPKWSQYQPVREPKPEKRWIPKQHPKQPAEVVDIPDSPPPKTAAEDQSPTPTAETPQPVADAASVRSEGRASQTEPTNVASRKSQTSPPPLEPPSAQREDLEDQYKSDIPVEEMLRDDGETSADERAPNESRDPRQEIPPLVENPADTEPTGRKNLNSKNCTSSTLTRTI